MSDREQRMNQRPQCPVNDTGLSQATDARAGLEKSLLWAWELEGGGACFRR